MFHTGSTPVSLAQVRALVDGDQGHSLHPEELQSIMFAVYKSTVLTYLHAIESIEDQQAIWTRISQQSMLRRTLQGVLSERVEEE